MSLTDKDDARLTAGSIDTSRRRTKIVATLGPATDDPKTLAKLVRAGVDVFRINFSHGMAEERKRRVAAIRSISAEVGRDVGIIGDLQGPKIRIESLRGGSATLEEGAEFTLDTAADAADGDGRRVGVAYRQLVEDVGPGDVLLLDDGQIVLDVESVSGTQVHCRVNQGGVLRDKKGLNKQGGGLSAPALTNKDRIDIAAAAELGIDFVSVSFARSVQPSLPESTSPRVRRAARG